MNYLQDLVDKTMEKINDGGRTYFPHVMFFFAIALQNRAKRILELGVRDGGSTYPFLVASKIMNGSTTSIDINHPLFNCPNDLKPHWKFHKMDAIKYLEQLGENEFDLIYVDDWHSYPHVKKELDEIDRIATPNTIILLHDAMPNSIPNYALTHRCGDEFADGGVYRALMELDTNKWEWSTIPQNHGMTILRKKGEVLIK